MSLSTETTYWILFKEGLKRRETRKKKLDYLLEKALQHN
jgi:hypothetical protein